MRFMNIQKFYLRILKLLSAVKMARYKNLQSQHETISIGLSGLKRELAYINQNNRRVNMDSFIGPSEVQKVMQDIIGFKKNSKVPEKEQIRILQLLEDYYRMRNMKIK